MAIQHSATERAGRVDTQRNRRLILEAARKLMARDGLAAQTTEIAELAGVGAGTIYRHFPTREDLVEAVLEEVHRPLIEVAQRALAIEDPEVAFSTYIDAFARALAENAVLAEETRGRELREYDKQLLRRTETLLRRAQDAGAIRPDASMRDIGALLSGVIHVSIGSRRRANVERYVNMVLRALQVS